MAIRICIASATDAHLFDRVAEAVFDAAISPESLALFLQDDRHHLAVATTDELVIGIVSAVDYIHPDKARELWINEVGVAPMWRGKGLAKQLMSAMIDHGRATGCSEAWVLTEPDNLAANALYRSVATASDPEPAPAIMHSFRLS